MTRALCFTIALTAALTACDDDGVGPRSGPLRMTASIGRSTLGYGDTTSIVFRVRNDGPDTVRLGFPSSCALLPYITTWSGDPLYPGGSDWRCLGVITTVTIPPGDALVRAVPVRGGESTIQSGIGAQANAVGASGGYTARRGEYRAFARFVNLVYPMVSPVVHFRVR